MRVKDPPTRLRCDSLSAHAEPTRSTCGEIGRAKLGARAQPDIRCGVTLALMGSSQGETEPRKATQVEAGHNKNP